MSLGTGLPQFKVQPLPKFERSAKGLKKGFKSKRQSQAFVDRVKSIVSELVDEPRHPDSRLEPIPGAIEVPDGWEFRKLVFDVPGRTGAAGEGRLIYVVNYEACLIKLLWLYSHEEFEKRPADKDLKQLLLEALEREDDD